MIHISKIHELVMVLGEFSITWIDRYGKKVVVPKAVFSGKKEKKDRFRSKKRTFNIICIPSNEVRTVKLETIVEINGQEVFI